MLKTATGSWESVFRVAAATNVVVVLLALFVLKPLRVSRMCQVREAQGQFG